MIRRLAPVLLALAVLTGSCVRVYSASNVRSSFTKAAKQVRKSASKAKTSIAKRKVIVAKFGKKASSHNRSEMNRILGDMQKLQRGLTLYQPKIKKLGMKVDRTFGKRKKISEKQARLFSKVSGLIEQLKQVAKDMKADFKRIQRLDNQLRALIDK